MKWLDSFLSHSKDQPVSFCSCFTATTADRFYRIDRAQVSAASSCPIIPLGRYPTCTQTNRQA